MKNIEEILMVTELQQIVGKLESDGKISLEEAEEIDGKLDYVIQKLSYF
jgi:hypothetical protein